jgi:predicted transcriptional regulator
MIDPHPLKGELQAQVMAVIWRLEGATVDQVRAALPSRVASAYTTVQTVMNRLAERGLLTRTRAGHAIEYRPAISEADHLTRSIAHALAAASNDARQTVLAQLLGGLTDDELAELRQLAGQTGKRR